MNAVDFKALADILAERGWHLVSADVQLDGNLHEVWYDERLVGFRSGRIDEDVRVVIWALTSNAAAGMWMRHRTMDLPHKLAPGLILVEVGTPVIETTTRRAGRRLERGPQKTIVELVLRGVAR